ncbi:meiotic spindle pole body protein Kms1 [Schizosaccharomyces cryophilus OY26]|uniref:Meiotic spindle pole body protein Kms1 n=1 Tax=Schizosaccharomyces cryophilus (strain OY26 / ATCC MYA-4695 / CBS 11777 / NBRC 106824 / NRRL Y48691) TaxID=653667 RepID=S9X6K2_SCHCR|nr:meiotic spindle pole body protein Kms1 [Schizosaccharomyces cryophilus OY26]EPY52727.1 meiotic spindle pole body protein Kms1 [Schizosaccharomyces cryophilus OY26]
MQRSQDFDLIFDSYDFGKKGKISLNKFLSVIDDIELLRSTSAPPLLNEFQKRATSEFVQKNPDLSITKENLREVYLKLVQSSKSGNADTEKDPVEQIVLKSVPLVQHSQASSPAQEHAMEDSSFDSIESPSKIQAQKLLLPTTSKQLEMKSPNIISTPFAHSTPLTWNPLPSAADRVANQFSNYGIENNTVKSQNLRLKELQDSLDQARDQARNKSRIVDLLNGKIDELTHYLGSLETQHREMSLTQEAQNLQIRKLNSKNEALGAENENFQSELIAKSNELIHGKKQLSIIESKYASALEELEKKANSFNELYKAASESLLNEDALSGLKFENHKLQIHCQQLEGELEVFRKGKFSSLEKKSLDSPSPSKFEKLTVSSPTPFLSIPFSPVKSFVEEETNESPSKKYQVEPKENLYRDLVNLTSSLETERLRNKELISGFTILSEEIGIQKWIIQSLSNMSPLLHEFKKRYEISMPGLDDSNTPELYSSIQSSREGSVIDEDELTPGSSFTNQVISFIDEHPASPSNVILSEKVKIKLAGFTKVKWRSVIVQFFMSLFLTLQDFCYIVLAAFCQQIIRLLLSFFEDLIQISYNENNLAQPS